MKSGLVVVAVLLLISIGIAFNLKQRYGPELAQTQDLITALAYWLETHSGDFPPSEADFLAAPFIEKLPDGGFRVRPNPASNYRREVHGIAIRDLAPFQIAWGTDLGSLTVDETGKARTADDKTIELVRWPSSPPSGKGYTAFLLDVRNQVRAAASRPAP